MTPMQELIKELKELRDHKARLLSTIGSKAIDECVKRAEQKLDEEKEIITDSYVIGYNDAVREHVDGLDGNYKDSEDYYNSLTTPQEGDSK